jgi:hypothetical protein
MANLCQSAVGKLREFLLAADGVNSKLADISARDLVHLPSLTQENVRTQRIAAKLADENAPTTYPGVYVFCDRMDNEMAAKFRRFSGRVFAVVDIRVTNERFGGLGEELNRYVEAVRSVLADRQGKWTDEITFGGGFRVKYREIELGGRNFIQSAQIEVELEAHE